MEMKDLLLWQKFLLVGRFYLEILVSNTKLPANNHHIASFVSPLVFSKGSVQISPRWISGSVSVDFSRCENWFLPGNSKVPAKSCSGHHYRLICQAKYTFVFCLCQAHLSLFFFFFLPWINAWILMVLFLEQKTITISLKCSLTAWVLSWVHTESFPDPERSYRSWLDPGLYFVYLQF